MKPKITPTSREVLVPQGGFIVSKTDLSGRITYVNRTFMQVADYTETQLLHEQHNVIRHPDMPRGVFRFLWDTLKAGGEFFGYVKNMTADGSFYWVFANITPDVDANGKVQGYYSVRRQPSREAIQAIEPLYAEMRRIEQGAGAKDGPEASLRWLNAQLEKMGRSYEQFVTGLYRR
jgi:PAS domain S-box-containing protein